VTVFLSYAYCIGRSKVMMMDKRDGKRKEKKLVGPRNFLGV
jgi:hypothetical protein